MTNLTPYGIFISSLIVGIFLAIQVQTGTSIDPNDLMIDVTGKIVEQSRNPQITSMWDSMKLWIIIIGITSLITDIFLIISFGPIGIISGLFGFLAGLFIILSSQIGVIFLIIGAIVSTITTK